MRALSKFSFPLFLTFIRIIGSFVFIIIANEYFIACSCSWGLLGAYVCLALTDFFDGYFARKFNQTTRLGSVLDPLADKLLCTGSLILFVYHRLINPFIVFCLISRDLIVGSVREYAIEKNIRITPSPLAKIKTFLLLLSIGYMYYDPTFFSKVLPYWLNPFVLLMYLSTMSAVEYVMKVCI